MLQQLLLIALSSGCVLGKQKREVVPRNPVSSSIHDVAVDPASLSTRTHNVITSRNAETSGSCELCGTGAWLNGVCYDSLFDAVAAADSSESITVRGQITVNNEIDMNKRVKIIGERCGGSRPKVISRVNDKQKAIFHMTGNSGQLLTLRGIDFTKGNGYSRLIRSDEYDVDEMDAQDDRWTWMPAYSLNINDVSASGFETKARGGSVIFLQVSEEVYIANSVFVSNSVDMPDRGEYYGGGGALWFQELPRGNSVNVVNSIFRRNDMQFQHGLGGALMLGNIDGSVDISDSKFFDNRASDGGAIHMARVNRNSVVNIDGIFERNEAHEQGWGSRGSALRFKYISGRVNIDGEFDSNKADEDRATIANNRIQSSGKVVIRGVFKNNECKKGGVIWDTHMSYSGRLTVKAGTKFINNESEMNPRLAIYTNGGNNLYFSGSNMELDEDVEI
eukprot:CFRG5774T1